MPGLALQTLGTPPAPCSLQSPLEGWLGAHWVGESSLCPLDHGIALDWVRLLSLALLQALGAGHTDPQVPLLSSETLRHTAPM